MSSGHKSVIVNSPYTEPEKYLEAGESGFSVVEGRRPSGYWVERKKGVREFIEIPLVNHIRPRVKAWREGGYSEATAVTRELLLHWHDRAARPESPFFFCQLEAIETLIFLSETREGRMIIVENDGGEFRRLCTKLCTGGGKTIVMSMLIAWQTCNALTYPKMGRYTRNFLVVAPNLTVRDRLSVLLPNEPANYYERFCVVPEGMRGILGRARVEIHNWHVLDYEAEEKRKKSKIVVKIPAKGDESYCRSIVGGMRNILVINDEAHHAWRVRPEDKAKTKEEKAEREEATAWMRGLDRIGRVRGISGCYDFSATPFVPGREKDSDKGLFSWIVSDFSLDDGIEAGIVKTPYIPVRDNALIDPKTGKSKLYHIYGDESVKDDLNRKAPVEAPLPDLVNQAYMLLGNSWKELFDEWQKDGRKTPPVMITVANRTETAARIEYAFTERKLSDVEELCEKDNVLRIDSESLAKMSESEAENVRERAATVGQEGGTGGQLRNVISVGMLSEGWDARTVTHIMGLRAFSSQLLCEQVVGRGLRRTSYGAVGDGELFRPEYVNVFGIPFSYLLCEEHGPANGEPPKPLQEVRALDERREYAMTWPEVEGISYVMRQELTLDAEDVPVLTLNADNVRISAALSPVIGGITDLNMITDIDLEKFYSQRRIQSIIFRTASSVYDEMKANTEWQNDGNKLYLVGQIVKLTEEYINSGRIKIAPELFETDIRRRKILLCLNMDRVIKTMWQGIRSANYEEANPMVRRERSTGEMPRWWTGRTCYVTRKSHINLCVTDSAWEDSTAYQLDKNPQVKAWAKNDHLGFEVKYVFGGISRRYRPDFLVRLEGGTMLILEVKGVESEQDTAKSQALCEWVRAVNASGRFGRWENDIVMSPAEVEGVIKKYIQQG